MGYGGGDVRVKKFMRLLRRVVSLYGLELSEGGNHNYKLKCPTTSDVYPIPCSHKFINKYIVTDLGKWLEKNDICTRDDYERLKKDSI